MRKAITQFIMVSVFLVSVTLGVSAQGQTTTTTQITVQNVALNTELPKTMVSNLVPDNGSYVTTNPPLIMLKHGQRIGAAEMFVDDQNVTRAAVIGDETASYSPPNFFSIGQHWAKVVGVTASGSPFTQWLTFNVEPLGPSINLTGAVSTPTVIASLPPSNPVAYETVYSRRTTTRITPTYPMGAPSMETSTTVRKTITNQLVPEDVAISTLDTIKILDNISSPVNAGSDVAIVLLGRPQGVASFDIVPKGEGTASSSQVLGTAMRETSPGVYEAVFHVTDADFFNNAMLVGHLNLPTGEILTGSTATLNDSAFYAMYVGNPLYATLWVPNIAGITSIQETTYTR